jgi:hypothetical protein
VHSDRRDLRITHPNAGHRGDAARTNPELSQRIDQNLLNPAHESAHIALPIPQIHDRIRHNLPRPVIGHVPAAIGFMQLNPGPPQRFFRRQQILQMPVTPNRNHVRVFDKQQMIAAQAHLALPRDLFLYPERFRITHAPEIANHQFTH